MFVWTPRTIYAAYRRFRSRRYTHRDDYGARSSSDVDAAGRLEQSLELTDSLVIDVMWILFPKEDSWIHAPLDPQNEIRFPPWVATRLNSEDPGHGILWFKLRP